LVKKHPRKFAYQLDQNLLMGDPKNFFEIQLNRLVAEVKALGIASN